jgi:PAS domain S-box-containing protein
MTLLTRLYPESRADLIKGAGIAAAYFGAAKLGLALAFENSSITAVWPPTGIALAGLVLWGFRFWPAVALGAFLANSWTGLPLVSTLGITVGNTLEALVGAYLLVRVARFRPSLDRVRDVFALVAFGAVVSTMVSATVGVTSLWIGGETTAGELAYDWQLWWLGDMGGDLIVAPLLFILATTRFLKPPPRRVLEGAVLLLFLFTTSVAAFSQETQVAYLVFPLLAWAALRFGRLSAASAAFTVAAASVWFTARGVGPFAQGSRDDNLLLAQTFVGVAAAMSLLMAAFVAERSRTKAALGRARDELEQRVKERTASLKTSRASLAEAQEVAHLGSWAWDIVTDHVNWSDELFRIYGRDRDSLDGTYGAFLRCIHPDDRNRVDGAVRKAMETCGIFEFEHRIVRPDGEVRVLQARGETVSGETGQPVRMLGTELDITEQKRIEEEGRRFWNLSLDLLAISDFEFKLQQANPAHERILGYSEEELKARPWLDLVHPDDRDRVLAEAAKLRAASIEINGIEARIRCNDGSYRTLLCSARSDRDERLIYTVSKDITEWKRAEESERLAAIVESSDDAIISINLDGTIKSWNPGAERLYGYSAAETEGRSIGMIMPSQRLITLSIARVRKGQSVQGHHTVCVAKEGNHVDVSLSLSPIREEDGRVVGASAIHRDISDRVHERKEKEKLEAELNAAHRLESIGQLAGGVAHDFNNILGVIINYARFVADGVPAGSRAAEDVEEIRRAADRAATLTRQLLIFGRRDVAVREMLSVNVVVSELDTLLQSAVGEHVDIQTRLDDDLWPVEADGGQIEQVLINLAVNSRDAMPDGGRLTIETDNVEVDEAFARFHPDAAAGKYVRLTVRDTGTGMDDEVAKRVFEPFFTTKPKGEGTGLGLATVYGIVKSANGIIDFDSKVGGGTKFDIYLPARFLPVPITKPRPDRGSPGGNGETVLLVEDEDAVRDAVARILDGKGYSVLNAGTGTEALAICAREKKIDLLLTDVMMPRMLGTDLAKRIAGARADVRVLYMSGYRHEAVEQHALLDGAQIIEKPFSAEDLLLRVRGVLDSRVAPDQ